MDFTGTPELWEKEYTPKRESKLYRNSKDTIEKNIEKISLPIGTDKKMIYENNTLTIIKVSCDFYGKSKPYRRLVRTETIPAKELPKNLSTILKNKEFKRIV